MTLSFSQVPESLDKPELFDGIVLRRVIAYLIDLAILVGITLFLWLLVVLTFGLLGGIAAILTPAIPLAYHTLLIGGRESATLGMRMMGIEVRTLAGERPEIPQAFLQTALFYATMALTGLLLIVALFNDRGRCLHDWLSGTVIVNAAETSTA
jgi:uncharacterized RDD family membrane protein YckC